MRYKMTFSYDGTLFHGYQSQKGKRTVEETIERELSKMNHNRDTKIVASGRTDAHVHALGQVAHFDFEEMDSVVLKRKLNKMLPDDIYIRNIEPVSDSFHARYNAKIKTYLYKINCGEYNPLEVNYIYQYNQGLNIEKMEEASTYLLGEHDFTSFVSASGQKEDMVRTIYQIDFIQKENIMMIIFIGNGFLQYMVRNMVGFLIEVGAGKIEPSQTKEVLEARDRTKASKTASPNGLYLSHVKYDE